jgi:hypothetical protein
MSGLVYTDIVFNVIGDYPVVDQFDVLYTGLLSGSMNDQYITGTLFQKYPLGPNKYGPYVFVTGSRGRAFSKLGENTKKFPKVGIDSSYNLQPWGERSGFVRNTRIFSQSERYRDSLTPSYESIVNVLGGTIDTSTQQAIISIGVSGSATYNTALGFHESFPFEPKFSSIKRSQKILDNYIGDPILLYEEGGVSSSDRGSVWYNLFVPTQYLLSSDLGKIFFGFGDRRKKIKIDSTTFIGQKNLPSARLSPLFANYYRSVGPIIRGWKYGLVNAEPYYTSAVFRRDRYGQFRDMLEQRLGISSVKDKENSPVNYFGSVETKPFTVFPGNPEVADPSGLDPATLSVVNVKFCKLGIKTVPIAGDNKQVLSYITMSPTETSSSNLSTYATSSLPFFDF